MSLKEFAAKTLSHETKRAIYNSPIYSIYSKHYLRYKFMSCKIKHKLNILTPELVIYLLSTYRCNFSCKHCEASAGDKNVLELSTEEICNFITELSEMKVKRIFISGGEPLVRKDFFKIAHHVQDVGM